MHITSNFWNYGYFKYLEQAKEKKEPKEEPKVDKCELCGSPTGVKECFRYRCKALVCNNNWCVFTHKKKKHPLALA